MISRANHPSNATPTVAPFAITCGIYGWMVHYSLFRNRVGSPLLNTTA